MTEFSKDLGKNAIAARMTLDTKGTISLRRKRLIWGVLALLLLLGIWLFAWGFRCRYVLWGGVCYYSELFTDREWIQATLKSTGVWAPVLFVLSQSLQVVFAPFPGEATGFIGGYLFGGPLGFVYSTLGLTLGSVGAFFIARWL